MLLVGAISVTIATLFSLIAMCMFFNTDAKIRFAVIVSYLILVLVIVSVAATVIRWLQFLINTDKRKFRIAFIVLGTICVILALFSTIGIFIFAKELHGISNKVQNFMDSDSEGKDDWYNENCINNPNGTACALCKPYCPNRRACDICEKKPRACEECECDPNGSKRLCNWLKIPILQPKEPENDNSTEPETKQENPLDAFLGEPAEDSPCKNVSDGALAKIKRRFCQMYELTNSWHCKNETGFEDKITCIAAVVGEGATKRNIVAGLLIVSLVGHLVNIGVAIWCTGEIAQSSEKGYEYRPQSDVNDDKDEEREKENGEAKEDEKETEFKELTL